ncbi:sepiapterin reductase [Rhizoctonia solani]|uniref:Sepiapterin reductase n=2 Tax=Rhizoctonia solani TaxID=456999 RepID=A0A8H7IA19_9AGAM|nr:sepiapterin reductase [Rhizoctonia solani]
MPYIKRGFYSLFNGTALRQTILTRQSCEMSSQPWNCALITGGGGGLGKVFAQSLIKRGKKVYLAGRTESNLAQTTKEIGAAGYFVVDVGNTSSLPAFVDKVTKEAPEIDCLLNNAGIQKPLNFEKGADLNAITQEINTNITGLVHLCALFIPHLRQKQHASIQNVASGLAYVPIAVVPVYCATKAFVKSFTLSLREQLRSTNISVIEISPPLVESDLHRDHDNPNNNKKSNSPHALTQEEWIAHVEKGWDEGKEEIGAGFSQSGIDAWRKSFGELHSKMASQSH